jgi:hypothetical protein
MADIVRIWSGGDAIEGELLRSRLDAEGIPSILKRSGGDVYRTGPAYLFVSSEDVAAAQAVLDAIGSGAYAIGDEVQDAVVDAPDGAPGSP